MSTLPISKFRLGCPLQLSITANGTILLKSYRVSQQAQDTHVVGRLRFHYKEKHDDTAASVYHLDDETSCTQVLPTNYPKMFRHFPKFEKHFDISTVGKSKNGG